MTDTSKCPKCGGAIIWANINPDLGMCRSCGFQTPVCGKPMVPEMARVAAMHRIRELEAALEKMKSDYNALGGKHCPGCAGAIIRSRELEARIAAKDAVLSLIAECSNEVGTVELAREALEK